MKTNLVVWGKKDQGDRVLIAMELKEEENKVAVYSFNADSATEDFVTKMFQEWKEGKEVEFAEGYEEHILDLTAGKSILPDHLTSDDDALISKTQAEWHYVVLSSRMYHTYEQELVDIEEKISQQSEYDNATWEELKNYWAKVQKQIQERTLFKSHGENLRNRTNKLFDKMKEFRKKVDEVFRQQSSGNLEKFKAVVSEIDKKIESGLSLQPLFEELKKIQRDFNSAQLTKGDRGKIWDIIDGSFKKLKAKRYGSDSAIKGGNQGTERIDRRIEGLKAAIGKMEASINWDNRDLTFENKRANESEGQLEAQIRQAKINMIEERISSKRVKLDDMNDTLEKLNSKRQNILDKIESDEEKAKVEETKKGIQDKIKKEIKEKSAELAENEQVQKAAAQLGLMANKIKEGSKEVIEKLQDAVEDVKEAVAEKIEDAVENLKERFEDNSDGHVAEEIAEKVEDVTNTVEEKIEEAIEEAKEKANNVSENAGLKAEEVEQAAQEVVEEVKSKIEDAVEELQSNDENPEESK